MAGTTVVTRKTSTPGSDVEAAVKQVNKLVVDVETVRGAGSDSVVAVSELIDDHATFKTLADDTKTALNLDTTCIAELKTTYNTAVTAIIELNADDNNVCNQIDYAHTPDGVIAGSYAFSAGAAVTIAATGWVRYRLNAIEYAAEMPATITLEDLGDISQNNFNAWRIEIDALGAVTAKSSPTVGGYSTAQICLLALGGLAPTANAVTLGYMTITKTGSAFNIGTDNLTVATATATFYYERACRKKISGLNAALGAASTLTAASTTYGHGTINVNRNGLKVAQIAAGAAQALTDADVISTTKYGAVVICTDLAGTSKVSLNAAGTPGVTTMAYASAAAALVAINLVVDRLPAMFVPFALIQVSNQAGGNFTFKTTNWDATSVTSTITDAGVAGWDRTIASGFNSHQITRVAIPALLTAPNPAAVASSAGSAVSSSSPATLSASKPSGTAEDTAGDLTAALIAAESGTVIS